MCVCVSVSECAHVIHENKKKWKSLKSSVILQSTRKSGKNSNPMIPYKPCKGTCESIKETFN